MAAFRPNRAVGCFLFVWGGMFALVGSVFLVAVLLAAFNAPQQNNGLVWVFAVVALLPLALGVGGIAFAVRIWTKPAEPSPPSPKLSPAAKALGLRLGAGFLLAAVTSVGGVLVAHLQFDLPFLVTGLIFSAPWWVFYLLFRGRLKEFAALTARALPSPEGLAAVTSPSPKLAEWPSVLSSEEWPTVPEVDTSPGRELAHELERADLPAGCRFGCAVGVAVFWNGIVSVFVVSVVRDLIRGQDPGWNPGWFLTPFVLVGLGMIGYAVYAGFQWAVAGLVGRVRLEVSGHPLIPGGRYEVRVSQRGPFGLGGVAVALVCEESATYVAGTSKSTAARVVAEHPAAEHEVLPLATELAVPAGAMHSFKSANNAVSWTVRVSGRVLGGLRYRKEFAACVRPGET